jgi:hypothetical protein
VIPAAHAECVRGFQPVAVFGVPCSIRETPGIDQTAVMPSTIGALRDGGGVNEKNPPKRV